MRDEASSTGPRDGWGIGSVTTHEDFKNFTVQRKDLIPNVDLRQTMH